MADSECASPLANTLSGSLRRSMVAEEALQMDPTNTLLWNILGTVLLPGETARVEGKEFTKQQCFERVLELEPENTSAWNNLGEVISSGASQRNCFAKVLEIDPKHAAAWINLGGALPHKGSVRLCGSLFSKQ